jgi:hypothetical protein
MMEARMKNRQDSKIESRAAVVATALLLLTAVSACAPAPSRYAGVGTFTTEGSESQIATLYVAADPALLNGTDGGSP